MISLKGYNDVSSGGSKLLPPGGYIARIVGARSSIFQDGEEGLYVAVDIDDGAYAKYFFNDFQRLKRFAPTAMWSDSGLLKIPLYENDKVHWRLKKFLETVKADNPELKITPDGLFDERDLIGKKCGIVVGNKESTRLKTDGTPFIKAYVAYALPTEDIRAGNFKPPELRKAGDNNQQATTDKKTIEPVKVINQPPSVRKADPDFGGEEVNPRDVPFDTAEELDVPF